MSHSAHCLLSGQLRHSFLMRVCAVRSALRLANAEGTQADFLKLPNAQLVRGPSWSSYMISGLFTPTYGEKHSRSVCALASVIAETIADLGRMERMLSGIEGREIGKIMSALPVGFPSAIFLSVFCLQRPTERALLTRGFEKGKRSKFFWQDLVFARVKRYKSICTT